EVSGGVEPLEQHRSGTGIVLQQAYRSPAGPRLQRRRFATGLVVNWLQLEHCLRTIAARHRDEQRNSTGCHWAVYRQLPSIDVGGSQSWQPSNPEPTVLPGV